MSKATATRTPSRSRSSNVAAPPSTHQIAQRAHEIYMARGGQHGRDLDDWLQAERELRPEPEPNGKTNGKTGTRSRKKAD